jgi:hypothetical protein
MMNLEEGFRRIGKATYWIALIIGILALFGTGNLLFAFLIGFAVIMLFHITAYVMKGFLKESDEGKDKD